MKKISIASTIFVVFVGLGLFYLWLLPPAPKTLPDISLNTVDGRLIELKSLQGSPLLVMFWATTCPMCIEEMPHLAELYRELKHEGFEIISIAMPYDPPNRVVTMAKDKNIPYPVALDINGEATREFGNVSLTPTSFLVAPSGEIIRHTIGTMDMKQLRDEIKALLESPGGSIT